MSLKHVVLAIVADAPAHGYAIHAEVLEALPVPHPCDSARIYAILVGLEREGRIVAAWEEAGRGRVRKRYRIAPAGARELEGWLSRPRPGGHLLRRDWLLQLAFDDEPGSRWGALVDRWTRRRDQLSRLPPEASRMARLLRRRECAHVDAKIRTVRALSSAPLPPARARSSAFR